MSWEKLALLRWLCEVSGGLYHQAVEGTEADQLSDLARSYARHARMPVAPAFTEWEQAIDAMFALGADAPVVVVLDEFPYLVAGAAGLPSRLQRALDARRGHGPRCRLVLCGSAMTVMTGLLVGQAPLRGRARPSSESGRSASRTPRGSRKSTLTRGSQSPYTQCAVGCPATTSTCSLATRRTARRTSMHGWCAVR